MRRDIYHFALRVALLSFKFVCRPRFDRVRCLVIFGDKVLLVRHVGGSRDWALPGGGSKPGESRCETAERELHEELDLKVAECSEMGETNIRQEFARVRARFALVRAQRAHININRWEIREAGWFPIDAVPRPLSPLADIALTRYENGLD